MVNIRGFAQPPGLSLATIRLPSQRQGFRRTVSPVANAETGLRTRPPKDIQQLGTILLNVVRSETHELSNALTRAPVDGEADRAQFIVPQPFRLTLTAIVSAQSDSQADSNMVYLSAPDFQNRLEDASNPVATQFARQAQLGAQIGITGNFSGLRKFQTFWARIKALNNERTPFEYISDLQVYQDMVFASIVVERATAEWIEFSAELEEFRTAGVTRDKWLAPDQSDDSRTGTDAGTTTPVELTTQVPDILSRSPFPGFGT